MGRVERPPAHSAFLPITDVIDYGYVGAANAWRLSNAWSHAAPPTWKVTPNFEIAPEVAYADVNCGSQTTTSPNWPNLSQNAHARWVGSVFDWSPVKNLDFALDLMSPL
jgi:hypothetical protein